MSDWGKPASKKALLEQSKADHPAKKSKHRPCKHPLLETALHPWYLFQDEQDSTLLEFVMVEKARKLVQLDPTLLSP